MRVLLLMSCPASHWLAERRAPTANESRGGTGYASPEVPRDSFTSTKERTYVEGLALKADSNRQSARLHAHRVDDRGSHHRHPCRHCHSAVRQRANASAHRQGSGRHEDARLVGELVRSAHGVAARQPDRPDQRSGQRSQPERRPLHGISPDAASWRLAGLERNYTYTSSTAGTFSVSATGDGTTITVP